MIINNSLPLKFLMVVKNVVIYFVLISMKHKTINISASTFIMHAL